MKSRSRILLAVLFLLILTVPISARPPGDELSPGPLGGRNMYAPHLPWFSFPAERASAEEPGLIRIRTGLYWINEFSSYPFKPEEESLQANGRLEPGKQDEYTAMDYESVVWELGADWQISTRWRISTDWRLHSRFGGVLDPIIESWHSLLGVANAGREYFDPDRSLWSIQHSEGEIGGSGAMLRSGDLDLRGVFTFYQTGNLALAGHAAFKIPSGKRADGFSSGYPDAGLGFLLEWRLWRRWLIHSNLALVLPLGPEGRIMGQMIPALEFRATQNLSILLQMNVQSSPVTGSGRYVHPLFGSVAMFGLPQTDLKIGLRGKVGRLGWQFFIEEDPFTWEGPDIQLYFGGDWSFVEPDRSSGNGQSGHIARAPAQGFRPE